MTVDRILRQPPVHIDGKGLRAYRSLEQMAAKVSKDEDFLMRASAQLLFFARLWPALENLSGRKPRGLGGIYGERALWGGFEAAADALFF